jgi:hypothetical protein
MEKKPKLKVLIANGLANPQVPREPEVKAVVLFQQRLIVHTF